MADSTPWPVTLPLLQGARPLRRLSRGDVADTWLVDTPALRCLVRVDRPPAARLGLDRAREWDILQVAHTAGLAPRPLAVDAAAGILVTEWIDAAPWRPESLSAPASLETLGRLLRRVHDQAGVGPRFDPAEAAQRYARATGAPGMGPAVEAIARLAEDLYPDSGWALCHHDPHAGNLLDSQPPMLVDWEYAANGQPLFDLAVVIRYHRLDAKAAGILLSAWAGPDAAGQRERLEGFCRLYDGLCGLWERAVALE